jgi:hypothetical protein
VHDLAEQDLSVTFTQMFLLRHCFWIIEDKQVLDEIRPDFTEWFEVLKHLLQIQDNLKLGEWLKLTLQIDRNEEQTNQLLTTIFEEVTKMSHSYADYQNLLM